MPTLMGQVRYEIAQCDAILESADSAKAKELCNDIISVYGIYIEDIEAGLDMYIRIDADYIGDLRKIKKKLQVFCADECRGTRRVSTDRSINIKNDNKNTNSNISVINLETTFKETIKSIKENGSLAPEDIEEILNQINMIKEISDAKDNKNDKWIKLRSIVKWTATKGITIATSMLNLITAVLNATNK